MGCYLGNVTAKTTFGYPIAHCAVICIWRSKGIDFVKFQSCWVGSQTDCTLRELKDTACTLLFSRHNESIHRSNRNDCLVGQMETVSLSLVACLHDSKPRSEIWRLRTSLFHQTVPTKMSCQFRAVRLLALSRQKCSCCQWYSSVLYSGMDSYC